MLELFNWGVGWEDSIPNEEEEVQEGPKLDCLVVTGVLRVFTQPEAEAEAQLDQVGKMTGFGFGGGGHRGHNGSDNTKEDNLLSFERRVLNAVGFKLMGEASVQSSVGLGVWRISRVREAIRKVGRRNCSPRLRNRLFPKSDKALLVVVGMLKPVSMYL